MIRRGTNGPNHGKRRLRALSALSAVGIVAGLAAGLLASPAGAAPAPAPAVAQQPHKEKGVDCDGKVYASFGNLADQLYTADRGAGTYQFTALGSPPPFLYNAIGVNPRDRFLYGTTFGNANNDLVRFDRNGDFTNLGPISGLPEALYISGTFDDKGNYYILADDTPTIYKVDVKSRSVTGSIDVPELSDPELDIFDIAFRDGFLWGSTDDGAIARIRVSNGDIDFFPGVLPGGSDFGGVFVYGNGDLGFFRNSNGELFRVHVKNATSADPEFTILSTQDQVPDQELVNLDATSCFLDSKADLAVHKRAPREVTSGGGITYRITVKNVSKDEREKGKDKDKDKHRGKGTGDSSGWSLTDDLPAELQSPSTSTEGCEIADGLLSCTGGPLEKGDKVEIEVTGTAASVLEPTTVENTATVYGDDKDPHKQNDKDTASTLITPGDSAR
ncbi:DUF11 domain-containing protein [Streptomyces sp. NBC_00390]|uniref:DUF11 domain-containing protein n=1 Tax=Streptomyces sp. NBC_00390 TaxID=2975736 RepID=UPI002E216F7A